MEVLILCAGAADKSFEGKKSDRPLRTKGKRQAQKIGAWMGRKGLRPDIVLTDSSLRARATAAKALKAAGWTAHNIQRSPDLSSGKFPDLPKAHRILIIAVPDVVKKLVHGIGLDPNLRPGVLLQLSQEQGTWELVVRIDPQELPDLFPYPSPNGPELRERPAYYYTQSAVIPYRKTAKGTEILIVGSSSGRHWVVPKGIVEPGLKPAASALVEAREEAGVEGQIGDTQLGTYEYEKWGATCHVAVFAMEVTHVLPSDKWEESHRERRWVTAAEAATLLNQAAFGPMALQI